MSVFSGWHQFLCLTHRPGSFEVKQGQYPESYPLPLGRGFQAGGGCHVTSVLLPSFVSDCTWRYGFLGRRYFFDVCFVSILFRLFSNHCIECVFYFWSLL